VGTDDRLPGRHRLNRRVAESFPVRRHDEKVYPLEKFRYVLPEPGEIRVPAEVSPPQEILDRVPQVPIARQNQLRIPVPLDENRHRLQKRQQSLLFVKSPDETDKAVFFADVEFLPEASRGREPEPPRVDPLPHNVNFGGREPRSAYKKRVLCRIGICDDDAGHFAVEQPVEKRISQGEVDLPAHDDRNSGHQRGEPADAKLFFGVDADNVDFFRHDELRDPQDDEGIEIAAEPHGNKAAGRTLHAVVERGSPAAGDGNTVPPGAEGIHDLQQGDFSAPPCAAAVQKEYVHEIPGSGGARPAVCY